MKFIFLLVIIFPTYSFAASNAAIMDKCVPDAQYSGNMVSYETKVTIKETLIGEFPSDSEWDVCEVTANLELAKESKIAQVKAEVVRRIPGAISFEQIQLLKDIILSTADAGELSSLEPAAQNMRDVWTAGKNSVAAINAMTTVVEIEAVDAVNDPLWP